MYNRYVPQNDGSFQRSRVPESKPSRPVPPPSSPQPPPPCPPPAHPPQQTCPPPQHGNILGFFRQLLPAGFDTGDLIVVLLLLLMAGEKPEDKNTALLTLALYCFL